MFSEFEKDVVKAMREEAEGNWYDIKVEDVSSLAGLLLDESYKKRISRLDEGDLSVVGECREYIYNHEQDILPVCERACHVGSFSNGIYEMRMKKPVEFLNLVERECAEDILGNTTLRNLEDYSLDADHVKMVGTVLDTLESNMRVAEIESDFQKAVYGIYTASWLNDHDMRRSDEENLIDELYLANDKYSVSDTWEYYLNSYGIDGRGTVYGGFDEFLDNEYRDKDIMHGMLPSRLCPMYDCLNCVTGEVPKKEMNPLSEEKEKEALAYLASLDLSSHRRLRFVKPFELLDALGVDDIHRKDCQTVLGMTHLGRFGGSWDFARNGIRPAVFEENMKEEFVFAINNFGKEKELMRGEEAFRDRLFGRYSEAEALRGNTVDRKDFFANVYASEALDAILTYSERRQRDLYLGIPYSEVKEKELSVGQNEYNVGKAWRELFYSYDGSCKENVMKVFDRSVSLFREGKVGASRDALLRKDRTAGQIVLDAEARSVLKSIRNRYMSIVRVLDNERLPETASGKARVTEQRKGDTVRDRKDGRGVGMDGR